MRSVHQLQLRLEELTASCEKLREEIHGISSELAEIEQEYEAEAKVLRRDGAIPIDTYSLPAHKAAEADSTQKYAYYFLLTSVMCFEPLRGEGGLAFAASSAAANGFSGDIRELYIKSRFADNHSLAAYAECVKEAELEKLLITEMLIMAGRYITTDKKKAFAYIADIAAVCGMDCGTVGSLAAAAKESVYGDIRDYTADIETVGAISIEPVWAILTKTSLSDISKNKRVPIDLRAKDRTFVKYGDNIAPPNSSGMVKAASDGYFYSTKSDVSGDYQIVGFIANKKLSTAEYDRIKYYVEYRADISLVLLAMPDHNNYARKNFSAEIQLNISPDKVLLRNAHIGQIPGIFGGIVAPSDGYFYLVNNVVRQNYDVVGFMSSEMVNAKELERIKRYILFNN